MHQGQNVAYGCAVAQQGGFFQLFALTAHNRIKLVLKNARVLLRNKLALNQHAHILKKFLKLLLISQQPPPLVFVKGNNANNASHLVVQKNGVSHVCKFIAVFAVGAHSASLIVLHVFDKCWLACFEYLVEKCAVRDLLAEKRFIFRSAAHTHLIAVNYRNGRVQNGGHRQHIGLHKGLNLHKTGKFCHSCCSWM